MPAFCKLDVTEFNVSKYVFNCFLLGINNINTVQDPKREYIDNFLLKDVIIYTICTKYFF